MFTAEGVARVCRQAKKAEADGGAGSIAGGEHKHSREVERRLRQAARKAGATSGSALRSDQAPPAPSYSEQRINGGSTAPTH